MVITRSQGDAMEVEEQRRVQQEARLAALPIRLRSPTQSVRSQRSTTSVNTRLRVAELQAAENLATIKRRKLELEMELEADLVKKRLAVEVSAINDQESVHEEAPTPPQEEPHKKVDEWLRTNPLSIRGEEGTREEAKQTRFEVPRTRSPTPTRNRNSIEYLAATLEKMARPRPRHTDLPTFSGAANEWLPFKAAVQDTTEMYQISAAENIQRLRSCLKGEARDAVAALLHAATDPDVVMKTLEQCFGRPEVIIDKALEDLKKLPKPGMSAAELNSFAVKLQNIICVLKTIDRRGYLFNPLMTREVLDKLSPHLRSRWCDYAYDHEGSDDPEIVVISHFLMREADRALRYTYAPSTGVGTQKKETRPVVTLRKRANVFNTTGEVEEETIKCPKCEQAHVLTQCPKYKALTVVERWKFVKKTGICFKCAQKKHRRMSCKAKPCGVDQCSRPHHATLHQEREARTEDPKPTESPKEEAVLSVVTQSATEQRTVLLKMCPIVISGPRGEATTYALLDEGATITLIDKELAESIGADGPSRPLHLNGVNMSQQETKSQLVNVHIRGLKNGDSFKIRARTIENLRLHQQSIPDTLLDYGHLRDLIPEEVCYDKAHPGLLVGTDHWECIVSRELRIGGPDQPAASRTQLGWVVHGTAPRNTIYQEGNVLHVYEPDRSTGTSSQELHDLVECHFKIDALGIQGKPRVKETDQRAIDIVRRTIKKIGTGYEVGLPWRRDNVTMPSSYGQALRRLKKIEQKMDTEPEFAVEYSKQIDNLLKKGYATLCDGSEERSAIRWYLPHFAVKNPNKAGKHRLVFDAAAKSNGVCLNDELLEGPDLLLSLPGILFRFREKAVAITADVQEMFLRINIRPEDQPAQQFLWRGNEREEPPKKYKMTSMIFGAASSPFMAHYVRNHNADIYGQECPRALEAIKSSHYMDDLVASYEDAEEAWKAVEETRAVHTHAGFTLRGWSSSNETVLRNVPPELHATSPTQLGGEQPESKILGLYWNAKRDELGFNTSMNRVPAEVRARTRAPTKREALSAVMSIYDPLGLLSHYTIRSKIKVGRRREKRWGALFTCLTSHAVHIELVTSLSTDSAIMALRRMAARRGWPKLMYSDNATNFRGADQELRNAYNEWMPALRDEGLLHRMEWRFIPPGAPNQGGAWERMVRSVKTALNVTLREKAPAEEVLRTLLVEAEFSINARPLTHVSVNPSDPEALTPNHFLLGSSDGLPTTGPCDETDRRTWRASQALADHFWRRWLREYLPTLVPRGEPQNDVRPIQAGDVVLVVDNTLPRNTWPMGIVEHTHRGPDGGIRIVEVRTRTGTFRRPVSKLVVVMKIEEATRAAPGGEL